MVDEELADGVVNEVEDGVGVLWSRNSLVRRIDKPWFIKWAIKDGQVGARSPVDGDWIKECGVNEGRLDLSLEGGWSAPLV